MQTIRRPATIDPRAAGEVIFEGIFRHFREPGFFHRPVSKRSKLLTRTSGQETSSLGHYLGVIQGRDQRHAPHDIAD
jgi:hypothetical protein